MPIPIPASVADDVLPIGIARRGGLGNGNVSLVLDRCVGLPSIAPASGRDEVVGVRAGLGRITANPSGLVSAVGPGRRGEVVCGRCVAEWERGEKGRGLGGGEVGGVRRE